MELITEKTTIEPTRATAIDSRAKNATEAPVVTGAVIELSSLQLALIGGGSTLPSTY